MHAKYTCLLAVRMYSVHNFKGTNFSTELILVQKRACTKSYENKFRLKISCYTVPEFSLCITVRREFALGLEILIIARLFSFDPTRPHDACRNSNCRIRNSNCR